MSLTEALVSLIGDACVALTDVSIMDRPWFQARLSSNGRQWGIYHSHNSPDWPTAIQGELSEGYAKLSAWSAVHAAALDASLPRLRSDAGLRDDHWDWWNWLVKPLLERYFMAAPTGAFDENIAKRVCAAAIAELQAPSTRQETYLTPIIGGYLEAEDVTLIPGVRLRRLTAEDVERWFNPRWPFYLYDLPLDQRNLSYVQCAIEITLDWRGGAQAHSDAVEQATALLSALRLATNHALLDAFTEMIVPRGLEGVTRSSARMEKGRFIPWDLSMVTIGSDVVERIAPLFGPLRKLRASGPTRLALALDSWENALERQRERDRLLDDWIALEALFSPGDHQEIAYRGSLRIATLLGKTPNKRERLYRAMRHSYRWRSTIIHGGEGNKGAVEELAQKKDLAEAELETRNYLRDVILLLLRAKRKPDLNRLEIPLVRGDFGYRRRIGKRPVRHETRRPTGEVPPD